MLKIYSKSISTKLIFIIPVITVSFWIFSSILVGHYLGKNIEQEFTSSNRRILNSISNQSMNDLRFYDYYQFRRTLHDFYDESYMDYFALYTVDMKPFAIYPSTQFSSDTIEFIERQLTENATKEEAYNFFQKKGDKRFHFQKQIKDETGQILGYLFMGGQTKLLHQMVKQQIIYFLMLGFIVLLIEISALIYFTKRFTSPIIQLTNMLRDVQKKDPDEFIPTILAEPVLDKTCSEVEVFDAVVRKLLKSLKDYQDKEMDMSVQATLGRLTSHFAHDIRTPITSLSHYLSSHAPVRTTTKEEIERYNLAKRNLTKIDRMADELTSYTKASEVRLSNGNIKDIINEVLKEQAESIRTKNIELELSLEDLPVKLDIDKINRVLGNIVLNSIQAISGDGGKISVSAKAEGDNLILSISDSGCGIKPEHLPRIFDSSFTYGKIKGTGLGLAYCKHVVDAHGGKISAESSANFTTLTIRIPGCVSLKRHDVICNLPAQNFVDDSNFDDRWLVVDDSRDVREQWISIFAKQKMPAPIVLSSPEELRETKLDFKKVRGAIVDYNFEGSNATGIDIIEYLHNKGLKLVHLCTGDYKNDKIIKEAANFRIASIIPKPIPEDIIKQIFGS